MSVLNLSSVLEDSARNYPNKIAIVFNDQRLTFSQINKMSNLVANGLISNGIQKGDKVALSMLNLPYFPIIYYGILKTGAVVVPLNVLLKRQEISYHLKDSDAVAYFAFMGTDDLPMGIEAWNGFNEVETCTKFWIVLPPGSENPVQGTSTLDNLMSGQSDEFQRLGTRSHDTAVILYTSGTTGQPKGAELTHGNIYTNCQTLAFISQGVPDDIHCITLPLFHSFGQTCQMNAGFLQSNTLVLIPKFDPEKVLSTFEKENITVFAGVPTMYWALLNYPEAKKFDLEKISSNLRVGSSGGSAMPVEVMKNFEEKFKVNILEGYGLSETSPVASFSRMDTEKKPGSIGTPIPGVEMMIADNEGRPLPPDEVGEILIRGPNIMKGYYKRPESTNEAFKGGWFHSGDMGKMDSDGYYYVVDRLKDMIIRGGFNVYPREIEEMMMENENISLVSVVGIPDEEYGEEISAYVVLKPDKSISSEELIEWSKNRMAAYKYPRKIHFRESLPMNATGKILKRILRQQK